MFLKFQSWLTAAVLLSSSAAMAESTVAQLPETLTPITSGAEVGARWITLEAQVDVPMNIEEHLLTHYLQMWQDGNLPESFENLKSDFNSALPEDRGFPVVMPNGDINMEAAKYWIRLHMQFNPAMARLNDSDTDAISLVLNQEKTSVDEDKQIVHLVYRVRVELGPKDSDVNLGSPMPLNLVASYFNLMKADQLKVSAVKLLGEQQLPRPRLEWREVATNVKSSCLSEGLNQGILTFRDFTREFKPTQTKCNLAPEQLSAAQVVKSESPILNGKAYPEYHELFRDNRLQVLIAVQECNEARYACSENDFGQRARVDQLIKDLKDFGYTQTSKGAGEMTFTRKVGELTIELNVFHQKRPVYFENRFWQLYPQSEIVITNRLPMLSEHLAKAYSSRYQILLSPSTSEVAWARILPNLDYALENFDGVELSLDRVDRTEVLRFVENVVQVSKVYKQKLDQWPADVDWQYLLRGLEKTTDGTAKGSAVAHFARGNNFKPNGQAQKYFDFSKTPVLTQYVDLLNAQGNEEITNSIDYRLAYLYLTLHYGDQAATFADLRAQLQDLCKTQISNTRVKNYYFYSRDCSPRSLLTSPKTEIMNSHFPRGSFLQLYYGKAGIPKAVYLTEPTTIGEFKFKAYYQDTAGAVEFYKTIGTVKQGHLAEHKDYKGLPLHGGMGTSMLRFYEDGTLKTALLRENVSYTLGKNTMTFHGTTRGPQQVSFHPTGQLECAYLAATQKVDSYEMAGVDNQLEGVEAGKEERKVCFHANGVMRTGMLGKETEINGTLYPVGAILTLNTEGKLLGPIYQTMKEGEYYWGALFPAGSVYMVNAEKSVPKWVRLNGELKLKSNTFPKGTEVTFSDKGSLRLVKAPVDGRPHIVFRDYSISLPENTVLRFSSYSGEPTELVFKTPIALGDIQYMPMANENGELMPLSLHENGRVASGYLAQDTLVRDPHYGDIPLKAGTEVEFNEDGTLNAGTLSYNMTFNYKVVNEGDKPEKGEVKVISLAAGTRFSLDETAKIDNAILGSAWSQGDLRVEAGGKLRFNENHIVTAVTFSKNGGQVGQFVVGEGNVSLYEGGFPTSIKLAKATQIRDMLIPAQATISFFPSHLIKQITADEGSDLVVQVGAYKLTRELAFYESGLLKRGYLAEDVDYKGVKLASLEHCQQLRFEDVDQVADSCAINLYEDGKSILSGISLVAFSAEGRNVLAGQPVEFDEEGKLFFK